VGNVVTPTFLKKRGLDVVKNQRWPYQHLGHFIIEFYSNISITLGHLHKILRKKLFCAQKVTTLPALTLVQWLPSRDLCIVSGTCSMPFMIGWCDSSYFSRVAAKLCSV
jgi:hypothetical protein